MSADPIAEPRAEATTPVPGPGSWRWDQATGSWLDIYPKAEPAQGDAEPADPAPQE